MDSSAGGPGYNVPDEKTREYIYMMAREEGIILDPCYTGKAFGGVVEMAKDGRIRKGSCVLLIHTGGTPGDFCQRTCGSDAERVVGWRKNNIYITRRMNL